ncbi:MAG: phosphomannomutase/phosphoglucomutase [Patescibacteria group bacterium]
MQIPRHIFKAYDIRGLVNEDINDDFAYMLGRAFATWLARKVEIRPLVVAVARDMRDSSPGYQTAVMRGLVDSGVKVLDIGLTSTPAYYFGVGHTGAHGGVQVTASHNPAQWNGFKLVREKAMPVSGDSGIQEIADIIEQDAFMEKSEGGSIEIAQGIPELHVEAEMKFSGDGEIKPFKVVADPGNGMGAQYLDLMFKKMNLDVERMYWELDGSFPNHESNPFKDENVKDIKDKVLEVGADLGIATDGDGDRIFFIDNKGELVEPAMIRGILAQVMLRRYPGATICYDIRPGKITPDMIEEAGGTPVITRVGHSLIKEKMDEVDAVFGGESSGHFFYRFDTGTYEGPVVVAMQILQEITASGKTFSEFIQPLKRYVHSGEINFTVKDKDEAIRKIKEKFADGELSELDGIMIAYDDFWFNVRTSNTEPVLRLNLEAVDQSTMEQRRDQIKQLIESES